MAKVSVIDQPVSSKNLGDKLGTGEYAETLADFIRECDTPITIGVQGEWGSGKTSLLNMIRENLETTAVKPTGQGRKKEVSGGEFYKTIWINTWEHSLLKSPEECLLSIIEEIIDEIASVDGSWNAAARAKNALSNLAKGTLRVGAALSMGPAGAEIANDLVNSGTASNTVKQLRQSLENIINTIISRDQNATERFVIFVDDLDRLEPHVAVSVLELLKNIFTIEKCVFVLAIDYQVVVKGLAKKFGKMSEENEWEFRAFFDKIIQLPFMMPMSQYDLDAYINTLLVDEIGFFEKKSEQKLLEDGTLSKAVRLTLGFNPRSMKRLLNSLSLLKLQNARKKSDPLQDPYLRQVVFVLVCCQISFPKIFELLVRNPEFTEWDDDFVNKVTGGPEKDDVDLGRALERAVQINEEDFNEDWEKSLFKIVWLKKWQKNRLPESSRLLSLIKDYILVGKESEDFKKSMELALEISAVTAVSSTEEGIFANQSEGNEVSDARERRDYWQRFANAMSGSGSVFDPSINKITPTHSSGYLRRRIESTDYEPHLRVRTGSSNPIGIVSLSNIPEENEMLFKALQKYKDRLRSASGTKVDFKLNSGSPNIVFHGPEGVKPRLTLSRPEYKKEADLVLSWMAAVMKPIEDELVALLNTEDLLADVAIESPSLSPVQS